MTQVLCIRPSYSSINIRFYIKSQMEKKTPENIFLKGRIWERELEYYIGKSFLISSKDQAFILPFLISLGLSPCLSQNCLWMSSSIL